MVMDLQLVQKGFDFGRPPKRKWVILFTALGFTGYGAYRLYHLPSVAFKRRQFFKLFGAFLSVLEAVSDSAESIGIVSKDLKEFLHSDSDQIPNSFNQLSKIARSQEFSSSLIRLTQGLTIGLLRGYHSVSEDSSMDSGFVEKVMDKVFSPAGSGFASVVVGSFARNLMMGLFSGNQSRANGYISEKSDSVPDWVSELVFSDKSRDLIGDCIQVFVSTAVAVYLDRTMDVNTYDELFSGLTNSKHEDKVKDMFVSVCNGAVETLVRTSNEVLTRPEFKDDDTVNASIVEEGKTSEESDSNQESDNGENNENGSGGGWLSKVSNTLAVPSNRRLVLDVTGRVTFETVRSFLEFLLEKVYEGVKRCVNTVKESVVERGLYIARYIGAKLSIIGTVFLSLCLNASGSSWLLMPA